MTTDADGDPQTVLLYRVIAEELARALNLHSVDVEALSGPNPLGAVASQFIVQGGNPNDIHRKLPAALQRVVTSDPVSGVVKLVHGGVDVRLQAFRKLASIVDFQVFVITTARCCRSRAVAEVRRRGTA